MSIDNAYLQNFMSYFTPFRIEDAQSNRSNQFISAPEGGILNENWCKKYLDKHVSILEVGTAQGSFHFVY